MIERMFAGIIALVFLWCFVKVIIEFNRMK